MSPTAAGQCHKPYALRGEYPTSEGGVVPQPQNLMVESQASLAGPATGIEDQQKLTRAETHA